MAIATGCPYLILDEPLNGLDPGKRKTSLRRVRSEWRRDAACSFQAIYSDDLADLTNSFYFIEAGTLVEKDRVVLADAQAGIPRYIREMNVGECSDEVDI